MARNPHFETADSLESARDRVRFRPRRPEYTAGFRLETIEIFVRDHKMRELSIGERSLEAHYGGFVVCQSRHSESEARRLALELSYGRAPRKARIDGHEAHVYELGPEVEPDDIDGRSPAVVVWHEGERFYLVASTELPADELVRIAESMEPTPRDFDDTRQGEP